MLIYSKLAAQACSHHDSYLLYLTYAKNAFQVEVLFVQIFSNHPCTHTDKQLTTDAYFLTIFISDTPLPLSSLLLILTLDLIFLFLFFAMDPVSYLLNFFPSYLINSWASRPFTCEKQWDCSLVFDFSNCNCCGLLLDISPCNDSDLSPFCSWGHYRLPIQHDQTC